jgi:D-glycero-alpha-D-manno-heptose-7-phosphate kinase
VVQVAVVYDILLSGNTRYKVIETLNNFGGEVKPYRFTKEGLRTWTAQ